MYVLLIKAVSFQLIFGSLVLFSASMSILQILKMTDTATATADTSLLWPIVLVIGLLSSCLALLGLQSVVWANLLQFVVMVACNLAIIYLGLHDLGAHKTTELAVADPSEPIANSTSAPSASTFIMLMQGLASVWNATATRTASEGKTAYTFTFREDFRTRYTFWNCLIGLAFNTVPT